MPDEPPSILPRGTGTRRPLSPSPALPGSAVYIQSVAGLSCIAAGAIGSAEISGGRSPASIRATRHDGSSERRDAMTAPAEPPPTTMKSNFSDIPASPFVWGRFRPAILLSVILFSVNGALARAPTPDLLSTGEWVPRPSFN